MHAFTHICIHASIRAACMQTHRHTYEHMHMHDDLYHHVLDIIVLILKFRAPIVQSRRHAHTH